MDSMHCFLKELIDYAGLFPPAALGMPEAVRNYASYLKGEHNWMLGRFIVPVARLLEFEESARDFFPQNPEEPQWRISALVGPNLEKDILKILDFNFRYGDLARIDTVEVKMPDPTNLSQSFEAIPKSITPYFEISILEDPGEHLDAIVHMNARAKVRTGGVTEDLFPSTTDLARFIKQCAEKNVPFKATAGLHHPIRGRHRLMYQADSPTTVMHGFLNVFLSAAFCRLGMTQEQAKELLEEPSPEEFTFNGDGVKWRSCHISLEDLQAARAGFSISFGSCSFEEPIEDLQQLKLI